MENTIAGKHALVTGGGTGIGLAIAIALAEAGAKVTITGRRVEVLKNAAAETAGLYPLVMDVCDETSVVNGFSEAVDARGPIDICIPNAGIAEGSALHKTDLEFWRKIMATNLDGAFLTIREAMKTMHALPWGRVIAISSIAGVSGHKGASVYAASKHGMIGLIRSLAIDYVESGKTFNAICPGYVNTAMVDQNVTSIQARTGMDEQQAMDVMVNANPHKRLIEPSEIAAAALWLCSVGSESVNGQAIEISGGSV